MNDIEVPKGKAGGKVGRATLNTLAGAIPGLGGLLAAAAAAWSEKEQEAVNRVFEQWMQMFAEELRDKEKTILEIVSRVDMADEKIKERIESDEYQSILKKAFRKWSSVDSESKRQKVRNLLSNAAAADAATDDVVKLFVDWIGLYSDFHFEVIGEIYRTPGIGRGQIWENLGRPAVREDSAEADLYRMLIRDLSTGAVIRQHRETDYYGNFLPKQRAPKGSGRQIKSAFDNAEGYELTGLGEQFVAYAMNELVPRIEFQEDGTRAEPPPPATSQADFPDTK